MLIDDVRSAIDTRAVMEAGNDLIRESGTITGPGAETYSIIRNNLAFSLTMTVARMFDLSSHKPIEKQSKASMPVLAYWLRVPGVRAAMIAEAASWVAFIADLNAAHCDAELNAALVIADKVASDEVQKLVHERVRTTRDARLAHSLYDKNPTLPLYSDIFQMLDYARDFTAHVTMALLGRNSDFEDIERDRKAAARKFWLRALSASWLPKDSTPVQLD